jgi:pimeloyl-ACP methyl ester carboxylesterase
MNAPEPFKIAVPDLALEDLRARLARTRLIDEVEEAGWRYGASPPYIQELAAYWRDRFDWRAQEAELNDLPQFTVEIDGQRIHFMRLQGEGKAPAPLILTHGWPSTFAEFKTVLPMLAFPSRFGGDADDAFDIIVPSLPGFGFSSPPKRSGMSSQAVAELWNRLMTKNLRYDRYFAHGGDIGDTVTCRMARLHPESVAAIHILRAPFFEPTAGAPLTTEERRFLDGVAAWQTEEGGYAHQQRTRPQSLAFGLNDSPVGLAAWIVEKWRAWSDCDGALESRFSKDELLTTISIYWFTQTIASSMRMYFETAHDPGAAWSGRITAPARLLLTQEAVNQCPRSWAERSLADLSYAIAPTGGHFFAAEEPQLLIDDLRTFFRPYRARLR